VIFARIFGLILLRFFNIDSQFAYLNTPLFLEPPSTTGCAISSQSTMQIEPVKVETLSINEMSCAVDAHQEAANTTKAAENSSSSSKLHHREKNQDHATCFSKKLVSSIEELTASAETFETAGNLIGGTFLVSNPISVLLPLIKLFLFLFFTIQCGHRGYLNVHLLTVFGAGLTRGRAQLKNAPTVIKVT